MEDQKTTEKSFDMRSVIGQRQERRFTLTREQLVLDEEQRTLEISFSSELPVERWFGKEILDHSAEAVQLERLNSSGPYLNNHDTDRKIGWVMPGTARVDADKKGRCTVRYSRRKEADDEWQDVLDGAPVTISVGYMIHELVLEEDNEGERTYRATKWEPLEVSAAPVAADITVGGGRSLEEPPALDESNQQPEPEQPGTDSRTQPTIEVRSEKKVEDQLKEFTSLGDFFNEPEMARDFFAEGKTTDDFKRAVLEKRREAQKDLPHGKPLVELNDREKQNYSISRAIISAADGEKSFEREISDELGKHVERPGKGRNGRGNSILIPTGVALRGMTQQRTSLTSGGATTGADIVFTEAGSFIDMLRNKAKVIRLGASVLPGLRGPVAFPKQTGAGTLYWTGENPGSDVTESNLTLDQVTLTPRTAMAQESYSRQLLAQANVAADQIVTNDLVRIGALGIDRASLHGSGSSNEPTGLYSLSGVNSVAFGGGITFAKTVDMETEIEIDNAEDEMMAYLTTPNVKGKAKQTQRFSGTNGAAIWEDGEMNGYRAESTNQLRKDMGGSSNEHGIIFGVWPFLYIGEWGAVELLVDPYTLAGKGLIRVIEFLMIDIAARYPEAFTKGTGLTA